MSGPTERRDFTIFTFLPGAVDVRRVCDLVRATDLGFRPTDVRIRAWGADQVQAPYDDAVWDRILATPEVHGFALEAEGSDPSLGCDVLPVGTEITVSGIPPTADLVARLIDLPGLLGGASGDFADAMWQGEEDPEHYRMWFDGPWEHLPRTTNEWGEEVIDVSGNPGRDTDVPGMRLWAAQDVWFGPASALVIAHDRVPSLPVGAVTDLGDGRHHVRLWEDGASLEEIRKVQQALRDHLGYDDAAAREEEIRDALTAGQPDDPMFVAQEGAFPHGGTERVLQYFSASRHPTTRSRAAWLSIQEYDDQHRRVHDEYVDLTAQPHPDLG